MARACPCTQRAKRRRRAPPSELQQWMEALSARRGGVTLMVDLDNNADAVPQLEAANVRVPSPPALPRTRAGSDSAGSDSRGRGHCRRDA